MTCYRRPLGSNDFPKYVPAKKPNYDCMQYVVGGVLAVLVFFLCCA